MMVPEHSGKRRRDDPRPAGSGEAYRMLGIGLTWVLSTALGTLLGVWLDGRLGTTPLLTLVGVVVGTVAGFSYLYHHAVVVPREEAKARRERDEE